MEFKAAHDSLTVANFMLEQADEEELLITHLALQKLIYFAHGIHLIRYQRPLVAGYFEAWPHGPVHPLLYRAFKSAEAEPIKFRAERIDPFTGEVQTLLPLMDRMAKRSVRGVLYSMGSIPPSKLRALSHENNSPWAIATKDEPAGKAGRGGRISNGLIVRCFGAHKVSLSGESSGDRIIEEEPVTQHRSSKNRRA